MTWADGVNLHLLCYLTWYLIIQETLQICHILTLFPCTPETWIFRASFSDLSPYIINFQRAKFKDISEKRACRKTDLAVKDCGPTPTPFAIMPLVLQPSLPIRSSRLFLMDWGEWGSSQLGAIIHSESIPIFIGLFKSFQYIWIRSNRAGKKSYFWQLPTLSVLKQVSWTNFHEAKVASRASRFEERLSLKFSPQGVTSRM